MGQCSVPRPVTSHERWVNVAYLDQSRVMNEGSLLRTTTSHQLCGRRVVWPVATSNLVQGQTFNMLNEIY
ncbi:hypothetical protein DPMN_129489 [Dreissena polymorpha]|uniref:Uncharacterized protein n=1 Tax=Dreissena polymorpha TaxID=45954 RepID=A0A9D4K132_DREPO|nr:hypothetical protein DPMN_129489 [Dreissena polymorpha]